MNRVKGKRVIAWNVVRVLTKIQSRQLAPLPPGKLENLEAQNCHFMHFWQDILKKKTSTEGLPKRFEFVTLIFIYLHCFAQLSLFIRVWLTHIKPFQWKVGGSKVEVASCRYLMRTLVVELYTRYWYYQFECFTLKNTRIFQGGVLQWNNFLAIIFYR